MIVRVFTKEYGTQSFVIKGGRKKRNVVAALQPFHKLEITALFKSEKELQTARSVQLFDPPKSIALDIRKSTVAVFITEVLYEVLKQEPDNPNLYDFLELAINWHDESEFYTNYHLLFLVELTNYLGIRPSERNRNDELFSLEKGVFQHHSIKEFYTMNQNESDLLSQLLISTFSDLKNIRIDSKLRKDFMNAMIKYFEIQLSLRADKISSHKVLESVFS